MGVARNAINPGTSRYLQTWGVLRFPVVGCTPMEREIMTPQETADLLRMTTETLRVWRLREQGPPWYQIVGKPRYRRSELLRWLDETRRPQAAS